MHVQSASITAADLRCMPPSQPGFKFSAGNLVISKMNDGLWYRATVLSQLPIGGYQIEWTDSGETDSKNPADLRPADICSCYVNKGNCQSYVVNDRGIFCECGWNRDIGNLCAASGNFDAQELGTVLEQCTTNQSSDAQTMINAMCTTSSASAARCSSSSFSAALGAGIGGGIGGLALACCASAAILACARRKRPIIFAHAGGNPQNPKGCDSGYPQGQGNSNQGGMGAGPTFILAELNVGGVSTYAMSHRNASDGTGDSNSGGCSSDDALRAVGHELHS